MVKFVCNDKLWYSKISRFRNFSMQNEQKTEREHGERIGLRAHVDCENSKTDAF